MLIRYFRSSFPGRFITIGVAGVLLWGTGVWHPSPMPPPDGPVPLYTLLYGWFSGLPYLAMATGFVLTVVQAFWFNHLLLSHKLVPPNTSLAAFMFLLSLSLFPAWLTLTPVNITSLLLLLILKALLEAYNQSEPTELVFTMGFFISLASFFYVPFLLLYGFLLISFLVYRSLKWRGWVSSLLGLITPFLYVVVIYFIRDRLPELVSGYTGFFGKPLVAIPGLSWNEWLVYGLFLFLILAGLGSLFSHFGDKTVELRKKNILLIWLLVWIGLLVPYAKTLCFYHPGLLSSSLALFSAHFFLHLKKPVYAEWVLWLLLLTMLFNALVLHEWFPV